MKRKIKVQDTRYCCVTDTIEVEANSREDAEEKADVEDDEIEEFLSDEISNQTGFCHKGFTIEGEEE